MLYSRRDLGKLALAALPATALLAAKPNSKWGGVQVGINAPYSFHGMPGSADDVEKDVVELGLSAVELRSQPIEAFFGCPISYNTGAGPRTRPTPEEQKASADAIEKWRLAASVDKFKEFRKKYDDAGIAIQIVKFDGVDKMKDEVVDYAFGLAKAVGAHAISCEIPLSKTEWLGGFATKHKMMVGYHGHTNIQSPEAFGAPASWEKAMTYSKYNGINLDIGHFIAANNTSPIPFLEKYADRVTHIHVKDRKKNNGPNTPFGEGDTPIVEVLQFMKKEKYPFQATIEFEYKVPEGSTTMQEIAKCVAYCKKALLA
ncbi:MAG TPA: TIM barrel protein [Candidatus Sulfopaludibacter sp.]|jgi:sugar phosphate isomerase/epimerase|nr:TIM barrel protein [Candidatus Sulfopaludibacter sp.]